MNKARFIQLGYAIFGLTAIALIYLPLKLATGWSWFIVWMIAVNLVTFLFYGIDKGMAKTIPVRVPELYLHVGALAGGFVGGWAGMFAFHHKTNWKAHPLFPVILTISTITYGLLLVFT
jgi:uncharacterized membrane protein YsdA (DUF1294 family)